MLQVSANLTDSKKCPYTFICWIKLLYLSMNVWSTLPNRNGKRLLCYNIAEWSCCLPVWHYYCWRQRGAATGAEAQMSKWLTLSQRWFSIGDDSNIAGFLPGPPARSLAQLAYLLPRRRLLPLHTLRSASGTRYKACQWGHEMRALRREEWDRHGKLEAGWIGVFRKRSKRRSWVWEPDKFIFRGHLSKGRMEIQFRISLNTSIISVTYNYRIVKITTAYYWITDSVPI